MRNTSSNKKQEQEQQLSKLGKGGGWRRSVPGEEVGMEGQLWGGHRASAGHSHAQAQAEFPLLDSGATST